MTDEKRVDPFGDLTDFAPTPKKPVVSPQAIRQTSEAAGFPSRSHVPPTMTKDGRPLRRRRTGRNVQLNLKVTPETAARFTGLADEFDLVFGELLEEALDAWEKERRGR